MSRAVVARRRRTQSERSDAMRKRLIDATLRCLVEDGYAKVTVSAIVRRAGVSRGAHLHHFPSKNALILEAADYLMRRAYRILGEVLLGIAEEEDRVQGLVEVAWKEIYDTQLFNAYFGLMLAAQHDAELSRALRELSEKTQARLKPAVAHYFESRGSGESPEDMFLMTHWILGGISASQHIHPGGDDAQRYVELWARLMATQMRARKGVHTPPPRPEGWDDAGRRNMQANRGQ